MFFLKSSDNEIERSNSSRKGKPFERMGRKTTGLKPHQAETAAGLPGKVGGKNPSPFLETGFLFSEQTIRQNERLTILTQI